MKKDFLALLVCLALGACQKTATIQSDIIGYVKLYDVVGTPLDDNSGISISAELNGKSATATSDKTGKFTLTNLATGTYNLTYSGSNYPTIKKYGITHTGVGSNFIGSINYSAKPDFKINTFQILTSAGSFRFSGTYSKTESRNMLVFFGRSNTVNKDNAVSPFNIALTGGQLPSNINYSNSNITNRGFNVGETIYAIAYPTTVYANSFIELETGKLIYPALGDPTTVQSFVLQ